MKRPGSCVIRDCQINETRRFAAVQEGIFDLPLNEETNFAAAGIDSRGVGAGRCRYQSGLARFSVNPENMTLKLMLILCSSLALASTECCR